MALDNSKNKIDPAFISHLREEKLMQQDRRSAYIRAKFTFVIGLFGFVAALNSGKQDELSWLSRLVYLIPFVAVLFDLYILGGEFAVKRIRGFLSAYDENMESEKLWDKHLKDWPKGFMRKNRFWVTNGIYIVSIFFVVANLKNGNTSIFEWIWFGVWLITIVGLALYLVSIEKMIDKARGL